MNPSNQVARIAGILTILIALIAPFSMVYVPSTLIIPGDAAATATHILASEGLFRLGMAADAVVFLLEIILTAALYFLLKPVQPMLALTAAFARLAMTVIQGINLLTSFVALYILSGASTLSTFTPGQAQALALVFLNAHADVVLIWGLFFGLHLAILGALVYLSGYIPKFVGVILLIAALCYIVQNFGIILLPAYKAQFATLGALSVIEIVFPLWLLIKGINTKQP